MQGSTDEQVALLEKVSKLRKLRATRKAEALPINLVLSLS